MLKISCSGNSMPSAIEIASYINNSTDEVAKLVRWTQPRTHVNWGRYRANSELNPDITNSTNKRLMRQLFRDNGVPAPQFYSLDEAKALLEGGYDGELIGRIDYHTKGRGLWRVNNLEEYMRSLRGTRDKHPPTHFLEKIDAPREYRVHIFLGKSIRISEKAFSDDLKSEYTTAKPQDNVKHVRKAAKKALEAVGLDFGAVDILADDENCWVLEVNASPGLGGSMPKLYADTFIKWLSSRSDV